VGTDEDLLARVRGARDRIATIGPRWVRADGDFERVSLPSLEADALRDLLVAEDPTTVIEIGLAYGSSALAIAEALVDRGSDQARHLIIDPYQEHFQRAGWEAMVGAGLESLCSLIEARSQMALPRLLEAGFMADAAFVDGSHLFHNVFVDLYYLRELVRPGGLVILDDCSWSSVATAVRYFELNTGWQAESFPAANRLRAFRLPSFSTEPGFEAFVPFGPCSEGA
jgi:predicted O-methyltransferase YrrM